MTQILKAEAKCNHEFESDDGTIITRKLQMSETQAFTFENFVQMLRISPLNIEAKITLLIAMRRSLCA